MIILIFSGAVVLVGISLLVRAIRGRVVSVHPHCRRCKFDLHGLTLSRDSVCPECGQPTIPDTPTVMDGLRVFRRGLAVVAILLMLLGAGGLAWPSVSQMPAIKNMDWYARFSEGMLLWLEGHGDKKALQELHDRMIPGELSDEGLAKLMARAFLMQADESIVWDERWGDVLLYGFILERMSDEDQDFYLEQSFDFSVKVPKEIGPKVDTISYSINSNGAKRGSWSYGFKSALLSHLDFDTTSYGQSQTPFQSSVRGYYPRLVGSAKPKPNVWVSSMGQIDPKRGGWWLPYQPGGVGSGSTINVEVEQGAFDFIFETRAVIYKDGEPFHEWEWSEIRHIERVDEPGYYKLLNDINELARIAGSLTIPSLRVPMDPEAAMGYPSINKSNPSLMSIDCSIEEEVGVLGTLWFENGEDQIEFQDLSISRLAKSMYTMGLPFPNEHEPSWLTYFTEHKSFWDKARADGFVSVIYRPGASSSMKDTHADNIINREIRWAHVPIVDLELRQINVQQLDGTLTLEWDLSPVIDPKPGVPYSPASRPKRPDPIPGTLLPEDDEVVPDGS